MKHTKGECAYEITAWSNSNPRSITIRSINENPFSGKSIASIKIVHGGDLDRFSYELEECKANAALIVEAFNVTNETGLTPRQLLEQRNELLEALQSILPQLERNDYNLAWGAIQKATEPKEQN